MDEQAFEQLYSEHAGAVRRYVRRRLAADDLDDALAEIWLTAWRRRDDLPPSPLPWLYGTARRVLANQRRGRSRLRALIDRVAASRPAGGTAPALADAPLGEALARLPERDREALLLTSWEGLSSRDAAVAIGCSPAAFNSRLHRARTRLAAELAATDVPPDRAPLMTVEAKP
ncbi:MAG TPA: RNA polymerase sigma factor [Thermoleophilaceae bacterium]|jgi:RNA polymerase sigma-70 factor (ECF subfamily)|nr:RNA polymerase sigma factor [Thermoleophilaceae bacterium]